MERSSLCLYAYCLCVCFPGEFEQKCVSVLCKGRHSPYGNCTGIDCLFRSHNNPAEEHAHLCQNVQARLKLRGTSGAEIQVRVHWWMWYIGGRETSRGGGYTCALWLEHTCQASELRHVPSESVELLTATLHAALILVS
jgi:hypothetical protein